MNQPIAVRLRASTILTVFFCFLSSLLCLCLAAYAADAEVEGAPSPLLQGARLVRSTLVGEASQQLAALTDGNSTTIAQLSAAVAGDIQAEGPQRTAGAETPPIDIVFELSNESTPQRLAVLLAIENSKDVIASIEVLSSAISANAGYQSLRTYPLQATDKPQFYPLPEVGARWLMVRVKSQAAIRFKELGIYGHAGPPRTRYEFKESPAGALKVLSSLKSQIRAKVSEDEKKLFDDARDGKLDNHTFAEASLIASGVPAAERNPLLTRIDELEALARVATADQKTPFDKGRKLLVWLHSTALKGGYDAHQTDVSKILQTGKYNCVSSAALYNILALRLGLDARAVEVPDHAFSILYDGADHADVQTTHPLGFDPKADSAAQKKFRAQTGFDYVDDSQVNLRQELNALGLIGIIYYNHGVMHGDRKEFDQSLACYFSSLSLEPNLNTSVKNALATLANWGLELAKEKKFSDAIGVLEVGRKLAPNDATLRNNYHVTWRQWIMNAVDEGKSDEAAVLLNRALAAAPEGNFAAMQSWVYIGPGEKLIDEKRWTDALDLAAKGLSRPLSEAAIGELKQWRDGVIYRCWDSHLAAEMYREAALMLERGIQLSPMEDRFRQNLVFTVQQWADAARRSGGDAKAEAILAAALKRYPNLPQMQEVATGYFFRTSEALRKRNEFGDAVALAERGMKLRPEDKELVELAVITYALWAEALVKAGKADEASEVLKKGQQRFPDDPRLKEADEAIYDKQMRDLAADKKWSEAIAVYENAIESFPESKRVRQNYVYLAQQLTQAKIQELGFSKGIKFLVDICKRRPKLSELHDVALALTHDAAMRQYKATKTAEAMAIASQGVASFPDLPRMVDIGRELHGREMNTLVKAEKWEDAINVGTTAMGRFPDDTSFENNTKYCYSKWAKQHVDVKQWQDAITIIKKALEQFPGDASFTRNLEYCQKQLP